MGESDSILDGVTTDAFIDVTEEILRWSEAVAAAGLVVLFLLGLVDVIIAIGELVVTLVGAEPEKAVELFISLLESVLLLLIIVEIYETIVAYVKQRSHYRVVRTVIIAGVIAVVRKVIVFRVSDYVDPTNALIAASSYGVILIGLSIILFVMDGGIMEEEHPNETTPRSGLDDSDENDDSTDDETE